MILIREMSVGDAAMMSAAFHEKPAGQYEHYYAEMTAGRRVVLLGFLDEQFAGYLNVVWESGYPPFKASHIPEIVDFNVLDPFRRRGVGTKLMDRAEALVAERSSTIGLGVGLTYDYGAAQALYPRRGYILDGRGVFAHGRWLEENEETRLDYFIALYMTKDLRG